MTKLKKINYEIIFLVIIVVVLLIVNIGVNINSSYNDEENHICVGVNRTDAKQVQSVLEQYYSDHHKYPDKKDLDTVYKKVMGKIPCYKDGSKMVRLYKKVNANTNKESYKIYFYDDRETDVKENEFAMTPKTDTNTLFK